MRLLSSSGALRRWWEEDKRLRPARSKGIYLSRPRRPSRGWRGRERVRVWLEGIPMGELEMHLDGKRINHYDAPPYVLGNEEHETNDVIPKGAEMELRVRARDGDGWLEQTFVVYGDRKK